MFGLGTWEIVLILVVILLLFGAKRLPEIGSSLGKGIREFKTSVREVERDARPEIPGPDSAKEGDATRPEHERQSPPRQQS